MLPTSHDTSPTPPAACAPEAARGLQGSAAPGAWPRRADPPDGLTTSDDNSVQQQVQQPERLLPIARNRYSPHQQLKRPSATVLPLATDLRNVAFEVNDLQAAVDWAATEGYGLVGGIGEYEGAWRMAYVRGPEGIIVSLAERIG